MEVLTIWKRKRPNGYGLWRAYNVGTDSRGTWAFTPAGSTFVANSGNGHLSTCEVAQDARGRGRNCVVLLPAAEWFVAHWVSDGEHLIDVDVATPPTRAGAHWSFDDLELDPFLLRDGTFGVEDEAEFVAACEGQLITARERDLARRSVNELREQLTAEPSVFLQTGRQLLDYAVALDLAPLTITPGDQPL